MTPIQRRGYSSSDEKNIVRERFDLPLLNNLHRQINSKLQYFGLPGTDLLDIKAWRHLLSYVAAVDRVRSRLDKIEAVLETQFSDLRSCVHQGEIDLVILRNKGHRRQIGGQTHQPWVATRYVNELGKHVWDFDIINLDYFGPFLPPEAGIPGQKKDRADALRKLFDLERQDAWKPWVLLITVEAELVEENDKSILRNYLRSSQDAAEVDSPAIDFLTQNTSNSVQDTLRLLHGVGAVLFSVAASYANLSVHPRGTILYEGAEQQPMIHLVYQFQPEAEVFTPPVGVTRLLRTPILRPKKPIAHPWFEMLEWQVPGITNEDVRICLDCLDSSCIEDILGCAEGHN
jgi:hypothetical protein